jgi:hypothetical protein
MGRKMGKENCILLMVMLKKEYGQMTILLINYTFIFIMRTFIAVNSIKFIFCTKQVVCMRNFEFQLNSNKNDYFLNTEDLSDAESMIISPY